MNPKLDKYIKKAFRCDPKTEEQKAWMKYGYQLGLMHGLGEEITLAPIYYQDALRFRWEAKQSSKNKTE